jgi:hypothetical protein
MTPLEERVKVLEQVVLLQHEFLLRFIELNIFKEDKLDYLAKEILSFGRLKNKGE